jgi:hypothetical protein
MGRSGVSSALAMAKEIGVRPEGEISCMTQRGSNFDVN